MNFMKPYVSQGVWLFYNERPNVEVCNRIKNVKVLAEVRASTFKVRVTSCARLHVWCAAAISLV